MNEAKVCMVCKRKVSVWCEFCHACPSCGHAVGCKSQSGAIGVVLDDGAPFEEISGTGDLP